MTTAELGPSTSEITGVAESVGRMPALGASALDAAFVGRAPTIDSLASRGMFSLVAGAAERLKIGRIIVLLVLVLVVDFQTTPTNAATPFAGGLLVESVVVHPNTALPSRIIGTDESTGQYQPHRTAGSRTRLLLPLAPGFEALPAYWTLHDRHTQTIDARLSVVNRRILLGGA